MKTSFQTVIARATLVHSEHGLKFKLASPADAPACVGASVMALTTALPGLRDRRSFYGDTKAELCSNDAYVFWPHMAKVDERAGKARWRAETFGKPKAVKPAPAKARTNAKRVAPRAGQRVSAPKPVAAARKEAILVF